MVTRLTTENPVFEAGKKTIFLFSQGVDYGSICIVRNSNKVRFPKNKKTWHKAGHLDPSCSEFKNVWIYTSIEIINIKFVTEV